MSSLSRLARKFIEKPKSVSINDVERLIGLLGYERRKNAGSEQIFHKSGAAPLCVPTVHGRKIKEYYIRRLSRILNLEDYIEDD